MKFYRTWANIWPMKRSVPARYLLIPSAFLIVSLLFLTRSFIKTERFSGIVGNISYIGHSTLPSRLAPARTRDVKIFFNGIEFNFTPFSRLNIVTSDGIDHPLDLLEFTVESDRLVLEFKNNVSLLFISDIQTKKVTLLPGLPLTIPPINEVALPAQTMEGFALVREDKTDLTKMVGENENYYVTFPSDTVINLEEKRINLNVSNNIIKSIVLEETLTGSGRTLQDWYEQEGSLLNSTIYRTSLTQYTDKALQSLQNHLDTRTGLITRPDEERSTYFSEKGLIAYVVGAIPRGQYNNAVSALQVGATLQTSQMTYLGSTFFDDVVNKGNALIVNDWKRAQEFEDQLAALDKSLFSQRDLLNYFDTQYNLYKRAEDLYRFALGSIEGDEDFDRLLGRLDIILNFLSLNPDRPYPPELESLLEIMEERTFWIKDDLFLFNDQGIAELDASLEYGKLIVDNGEILGDPLLQASGWKFVLSCLKYSDIDGYIPRRLIYSDQNEPEEEGRIPPEQLYEILNDSRYTPRRISLKTQLGAGAWAVTASSKLSVQSTPRETVINVDFPIGSEHYFMIKGVAPFTELHLHGIRWKSDNSFQRYYAGWFYDESKRTLYVKIRHRNATETVKLFHYDRTAPSAGAATASP